MYKTATRKKLSDSEFDLYNDLEKIKAALADTAMDVKGKAGEMLIHSLDDVKDRTSELQNTVTAYVNEKPIKTISLTLLAGVVIGYLINR